MDGTSNSPRDDLDGTFEYLPEVLLPISERLRAVPASDNHASAGGRSASRSQKVDGVLEQLLGDLDIGDLEEVDVPRALSEWLAKSGLQMETTELSELVDRIRVRLRGGGAVR